MDKKPMLRSDSLDWIRDIRDEAREKLIKRPGDRVNSPKGIHGQD